MTKLKPLADQINDWNMKEIVYKCPRCNTPFRALGSLVKFCYNCGQEIDWNVLQVLPDTISYMYATQSEEDKYYSIEEYKKHFLNELNAKQQGGKNYGKISE